MRKRAFVVGALGTNAVGTVALPSGTGALLVGGPLGSDPMILKVGMDLQVSGGANAETAGVDMAPNVTVGN